MAWTLTWTNYPFHRYVNERTMGNQLRDKTTHNGDCNVAMGF